MKREIVLDGYIYVSVKDEDNRSSEEIIEEAKQKAMQVLEDAGLDCQIFKEELREI